MMKRVEIEDARLASSVTEVLMGSDVPPRKKFIYEHAQDAEMAICYKCRNEINRNQTGESDPY